MALQPVIIFLIGDWRIVLRPEWARRLADYLDALASEGIAGAGSARSQIDRHVEGAYDAEPSHWYPQEKDALMAAIWRWVEDAGWAEVPDAVRFDLRYALHREYEDDRRGQFLFELHRNGTVREVAIDQNRSPVRGQHVTIDSETWIVDAVAPMRGAEWVATVRATWHPG